MQKQLIISAVLFTAATSFAVVGTRTSSVLTRGTVLNPFTLTVQPVNGGTAVSGAPVTAGGLDNGYNIGDVRPGPFTPPPRSPYTPPPR